MNDEPRCPACQSPLPANSPQGLCPGCLLKRGFLSTAAASQAGSPGGEFAAPSPDALAAQFPDLEILQFIGRGGMGIVYKARQKQLGRLVALKILSPTIARDPAFAERFVREARTMALLNHPHIVAVYDFGDKDGTYYFVMEFVDGLTLRQLLDAGKLAPREALAIVPQICDALQFAHDHGVVHRDIKPENILLGRGGQVKIADFGLAKLVGPPAQGFPMTITGTGQVMGTPHYMAPEQFEHPQEVDHRADIYSLGVVFYQMLTGELPMGRFAPPSQKVQLDVRLDEVVLRALEKEPERRYQQASQVKTEVDTIVHSAEPPPSPAGNSTANDPRLEQARQQVRGPAAGLLVTGILNWLAVPVIVAVMAYLTTGLPSSRAAAAYVPAIAALLICLAFSCLVIFAALKMRQLEAYGLAVAAAILAILITPSNVIGLPLGIWSLVVLSRPEVREAFARKARSRRESGPSHPLRWSLMAIGLVAVCCALLGVATFIAGRSPKAISVRAELNTIGSDAPIGESAPGGTAAADAHAESPGAAVAALRGVWKVVRVEKGKDGDDDWSALLEINPPYLTQDRGRVAMDPAEVQQMEINVSPDEELLLTVQLSPKGSAQLAGGGEQPLAFPFHCHIDPTAAPKTMDLAHFHGARLPPPKPRGLGIYAIQGDQLKLCLARYLPAVKSDQRPKSFTIDRDSEHILFVMQRQPLPNKAATPASKPAGPTEKPEVPNKPVPPQAAKVMDELTELAKTLAIAMQRKDVPATEAAQGDHRAKIQELEKLLAGTVAERMFADYLGQVKTINDLSRAGDMERLQALLPAFQEKGREIETLIRAAAGRGSTAPKSVPAPPAASRAVVAASIPLEFHIVPRRLGFESKPTYPEFLKDTQQSFASAVLKELAEKGPAKARPGDGEFCWIEAGKPVHQPDVLIGDYQGKKYLLVCARDPYVLLPQTRGPDAWRVKKWQAAKDERGQPILQFGLDQRGGELFAAFTGRNQRSLLATVVGGRVVAVARLMSVIHGEGVLSGQFTEKEVQEMATLNGDPAAK